MTTLAAVADVTVAAVERQAVAAAVVAVAVAMREAFEAKRPVVACAIVFAA